MADSYIHRTKVAKPLGACPRIDEQIDAVNQQLKNSSIYQIIKGVILGSYFALSQIHGFIAVDFMLCAYCVWLLWVVVGCLLLKLIF